MSYEMNSKIELKQTYIGVKMHHCNDATCRVNLCNTVSSLDRLTQAKGSLYVGGQHCKFVKTIEDMKL